ncbi:hypothetical protein U9M48_013851 [Paspalum notatum var. saurae]|uniref:DUF659 domain-containing protein n=1 Tax=Paspalum notatum var. saurae TaxID=547442 RepID=A0AAQ3WK26_PASNO
MATSTPSSNASASASQARGSGSSGSVGSVTVTDPRAPLWDHVNILEKAKPGVGGKVLWKCKYCDFSKATSYTRVEAHLLWMKNKGVALCPKVSYEMPCDMRREVQRCKELVERERTRYVPLPTGPAPSNETTARKKKRGPASALEKVWDLDNRRHLDALLARAFYSGRISFNFARNPYFREAISFACSHDLNGYVGPGYNKYRESLLVQERRHIDGLLESSKSVWPEKGVTICCDDWSDRQRRPIIDLLAVCDKSPMRNQSPMFLRADNCQGEIKTKEYIADKLRGIIEEVGRHNVVQIITDTPQFAKVRVSYWKLSLITFFWTPCVVHTLNLAMKSICEPKPPKNNSSDDELFIWSQLEFMHNVKSEAQMIKNFIMNHGMRLSMFNEFSDLKLLSIAETRFASVVCMLKRFVEVKAALQHMVISDKWSIYKDDAPTAQVVKEKILSDVWWGNVDFILKITAPIYEMIRLADTDTPCLHLIYEMWDSMIEKVKKEIYLWEGKELNEDSTLYSHDGHHRYHTKKWLEEGVGRVPPHKDKEVSQMRMQCFKKFFRNPEELAQVKEEYSRFSSCSGEFNDLDSIHDRFAVSPMTWGINHGQSIPLLMNLAIKLISQPASSSCCERNWSTYSFIHSVKRNALTVERAEDLASFKKGETRLWDVSGDSWDTMGGVGLLEVADLSLDEPELQGVSFGSYSMNFYGPSAGCALSRWRDRATRDMAAGTEAPTGALQHTHTHSQLTAAHTHRVKKKSEFSLWLGRKEEALSICHPQEEEKIAKPEGVSNSSRIIP